MSERPTLLLKRSYAGVHPGGLALIYLLSVIGVATLMPFDFRYAEPEIRLVVPDLFDLVANVALFVPLGFFVAWRGQGRLRWVCLQALLVGFGASAAIETAQLWLPERFTALSDLLTNTLGALLGFGLHALVMRFSERRLSGQMLLDLPLMVFLYLVTPLMWLAAVATFLRVGYMIKVVLLGAAGAWIVAAVWRFRLESRIGLPWTMGVWSAWLGFTLAPLWFVNRWLYFAVAAGLLITAWLRSWYLLRFEDGERRFEMPTLLWVWPCFALYLLCMALMGPVDLAPGRDAAFELWLGLPFDEFTRVRALGLVEHVAAFSLLGFLFAQTLGRGDRSALAALMLAIVFAAAVGVALELIHVAIPAHRGSVLRLGLSVGAGTYGAVLYRAQLGWVRHLLQPGPRFETRRAW